MALPKWSRECKIRQSACERRLSVFFCSMPFAERYCRKAVKKINSFMSWIGGKKSSRDIIIPRFPLWYEKYIEVFGGGGWILFGKPPNNDFEVFNDFNSNISNLFTCVRDRSSELIERLRYVLNCREDFDRIKHIISEKAKIGDVKRAAEFYQLIRYSYASGCDSFGGKPHSMWGNFSLFGNLESTNNSLLDYSFTDTEIPADLNDEQRTAIENMRQWLSELDAVIAEKEENSLDGNMVRAVFYSLKFGAEMSENENIFDYERFCSCFEGLTAEQLDTALDNVSVNFPQYEITENHKAMIQKVYEYLKGKNI